VKLQSNIYLFMWSAHCQDYVFWGSQPVSCKSANQI